MTICFRNFWLFIGVFSVFTRVESDWRDVDDGIRSLKGGMRGWETNNPLFARCLPAELYDARGAKIK